MTGLTIADPAWVGSSRIGTASAGTDSVTTNRIDLRASPTCVFLALVALLALSAAPARADDPFPRLGLYGHVDGRGAPVVLADGQLDATLLDRIARHHLVVLDATPFTEYRPDALVALRARRNGIKLLGYVQAQYIFRSAEADSSVNVPTRINILVRNLGGYLYDTDGEQYNTANINLAKKDAQGRFAVAEGLADFFVDHVLGPGGWDGLYFDRFCTSLSWMQGPGDSVDFVRAGYPSFAAFDAAWSAATDTLANRLRRRAGETPIFIGNCGQGNKFAVFNGWMRENFPYQNGGTWQTNVFRNPGGYLYEEPLTRTPYAGWMTAWPSNVLTPYSSDNMRRARYALGTAALGEGYGSLNPPDIDPTTGYLDWWFDEFSVDRRSGVSTNGIANTGWLGRATGPYSQMIWIQPGVEDAGAPNPGFEASLTPGWTFSTYNNSTWSRDETTAGDGSASVRISIPLAAGDANSAVLASSSSISYMPDTYSATFWAKASSPRTIWIVTANASSGVPYAWIQLALDTTWRRYQVTTTGQLGTARIQFRVGGTPGDVWLDDIHFQRGAPNVYRRDFDYGIVLVNPANRSWDVALEKKYRRILGSRDPAVNNGALSQLVSLPAQSALFLLRTSEEIVGAGEPPPGPRLAWSAASPSPARAGADVVRLVLALPGAGEAAIDLHDARGRRIRRLHAGPLAAGAHAFAWDGRDEAGRAVAPGVYFARAATGAEQAVRKLILR